MCASIATGEAMYALAQELYPLCRSITGGGTRATLDMIARHVALDVQQVPSGTKVLDWTVPREWNIRDAWIKNRAGERVVDFRTSNLHVVNYSVPVHRWMSPAELRPHLHSLPEHPEWIPYRTSYYHETWGFCVPDRLIGTLTDDAYEVCIDSTLADGNLTYGECVIPGDSTEEVLFSCHVCHPSLANDNLSGIGVAVALAQYVAGLATRRYTYRFLFIPGTIGSITWLARNRDGVGRVRHGLVLTCVGDGGPFTYKQSRRGDADIDRIVRHVLAHGGAPFAVQAFSPYGYDERQFCSPGFDMPVGCFMRSPHGSFPQYHTSADDFSLVRPEHLEGSLRALRNVIDVLEHDAKYVNREPYGEPQLGKRGLYQAIGGTSHASNRQLTMLWILNQSDGTKSLLDIAERAGVPFADVLDVANVLRGHELLAPVTAR